MESAIKMDQEKFPHCFYSRQTSSSYVRDSNGQTKCEELQKAYRNCPNERPIQIYSNTATTSNESASEEQPVFGGGGLSENIPESLEGMMKQVESMFGGSMFGGSVFGGFNRGNGNGEERRRQRWQDRPRQMKPPHKGDNADGSRSFREYDGLSEEV
jgi:hypothetical protein